MSVYKAVVENTNHTVWSGTRRECEAYVEGAHANAVNPYLAVVPAGCCCGPNRKEVRRASAGGFVARVGCLTCDTWDEPVRCAAGGDS